MKKHKTMIFVSALFGLAAVLLFFVNAYAEFSLSATAFEGGFDLRYGKVVLSLGRINKELSIRITSDIGKQYRLVQNILDPLSTPEGNTIPRDSFIVYGIRGTNKFGTLVGQEILANPGRQIIYTSNESGSADSFTLVYGLTLPRDIPAGSYRGRISFSIEAVDSSQPPAIVILNVFAEVEVVSTIQIKTVAGSKNILLKADKQDEDTSSVVFNIIGASFGQFRIIQVVPEQPVSSENQQLDWEAINFSGQGAQKGMVINQPIALSDRQQIIYTSSPQGDADNFVIKYSTGDLLQQKSGIYRAKIKYILEGIDSVQTRLLDTFWLELDNPRVFELSVTPEAGGSIRFQDLKPLAPPKTQEVVLEVKSNIGKQYQVTQNMRGALTNKEGKQLPAENFTIREEALDTKGVLKFSQKAQVKDGQSVLFISDKYGSPDKFKVIYELSLPRDIFPGDYSTNFSYTINEI